MGEGEGSDVNDAVAEGEELSETDGDSVGEGEGSDVNDAVAEGEELSATEGLLDRAASGSLEV